MAILGDHAPGERAPWLGTGVLVALAEKRFLLTAGHCVEDAGVGERAKRVLLAITREPRRLLFELPRRGYVNESGFDFGYFEVPGPDRHRIETEKVFMSHERILVARRTLLADDDHYVVSGFPRSLADASTEGVEMLRHNVVATSCAGHRKAPSCPILLPPGLEAIDLAYDDRAPHADLNMRASSDALPDLRGASGGACWKGNVLPTPEHWEPAHLRLVGTHSRRHSASSGESYMYMREVLIGHHLALIAKTCPDMADFVFTTWPELQNWPSAPVSEDEHGRQ